MTRKEETAKIANAVSSYLCNLYERWQDEKEYEDFNDYKACAKKAIENAGGTFVDLGKRPFRCIFVVQGVRCFIKVTSREYNWGTMGKATHN